VCVWAQEIQLKKYILYFVLRDIVKLVIDMTEGDMTEFVVRVLLISKNLNKICFDIIFFLFFGNNNMETFY